MAAEKRKKIIRLLGVGFDAEDEHIRITHGDKYDIYMGSESSHAYLQQFIQKIEKKMELSGVVLDELTPAEFSELVGSIQP